MTEPKMEFRTSFDGTKTYTSSSDPDTVLKFPERTDLSLVFDPESDTVTVTVHKGVFSKYEIVLSTTGFAEKLVDLFWGRS